MRSYDEIDALSGYDRAQKQSVSSVSKSNDTIRQVMNYGKFIADKEKQMQATKSYGDLFPR